MRDTFSLLCLTTNMMSMGLMNGEERRSAMSDARRICDLSF